MLDRNELDLFANRAGNIIKVLQVAPRQDYGSHSGAIGSEHLFLDAPNGQDAATQGYLPGHSQVTSYRLSTERGDHSDRHSDACGGSIFGDTTGREVDMDITLLVEGVGQAERASTSAGEGQGRLRRFPHHLAELSGHNDATPPRDHHDLYRGQVSAGGRPGKPRCHPDLIVFLSL
jgi:hypothetical protein